MNHNNLPIEAIIAIKNNVIKARNNYKLMNLIPRDDIFSLLEEECVVLYYPLDNKDINGMHVTRTVGQELEHFVYINTKNPIEKQVYCAAHELGHILGLDQTVRDEIKDQALDSEAIINRFAAELLMPEEEFRNALILKLKEMGYEQKAVSITMDSLLRIVVYLMNFFLVPYKAIVLRMEEMNIAAQEVIDGLETLESENQDRIIAIIEEGKFERLNTTNERKNMKNLTELLLEAKEKGVISQRKLKKLQDIFEIKMQDAADIPQITKEEVHIMI